MDRRCVRCGVTWLTELRRGRPPKFCGACRAERKKEFDRRPPAPLLARSCSWCGEDFVPLRRRTAKFCSSRCAAACRQRVSQPVRARVSSLRACALCGDEFRPWSSLGRFCSKSCINRAGTIRGYGISVERYRELMVEQKRRCAACGEPLPSRVCIDHDHTTGKVRGLLCSGCNIAAGHIERRGDAVVAFLARHSLDVRDLL